MIPLRHTITGHLEKVAPGDLQQYLDRGYERTDLTEAEVQDPVWHGMLPESTTAPGAGVERFGSGASPPPDPATVPDLRYWADLLNNVAYTLIGASWVETT